MLLNRNFYCFDILCVINCYLRSCIWICNIYYSFILDVELSVIVILNRKYYYCSYNCKIFEWIYFLFIGCFFEINDLEFFFDDKRILFLFNFWCCMKFYGKNSMNEFSLKWYLRFNIKCCNFWVNYNLICVWKLVCL